MIASPLRKDETMASARIAAWLMVLVLGAYADSSAAQTSSSAESQIQRILSAEEVAWNVGDSISWGSAFAEDADFVNILGQVFHGREAIVQVHGRVLAGPYQGSHTKITIRQFKQITPDVALIETVHEVTGYKFLPPGIIPTSAGVLRTRMKYVAVRRDEAWQFIAAQNTAILPEPSIAPGR
jgi:uncharacterized protein (TIGR02246 family)